MEVRNGVKGTVHEGVFFSESAIPNTKVVEHVQVEISRQNATLAEVKTRLAQQVMACGATALASFRYGQKKHEWWEQVFTFKWDTESWHGEGDAVK